MDQTQNYCSDLTRFLETEILTAGTTLDADSELAAVGVDSFALMEVILFIERQFGIVLPMETLTPEATRTVRGLAHCIAGLHVERRIA